MGSPMNVRTEYDPAGTATVTLPREGVDIGPMPDFWKDFEEMQKRMKPRPTPISRAPRALDQAQAFSPSGGGGHESVAPAQAYSGYRQTFGVPNYGGQLYEPWSPGQRFATMYPPVFTGWWR